MKKSVLISFNWVIGIFIGAIVLIILLKFGTMALKVGEEEQQINLYKIIKEIFLSRSTIPNSASKVILKKSYVVNSFCNNLVFKKIKSTIDLDTIPYFSPKEFRAKEITIFSRSLKMPFFITNYLFIVPSNDIFFAVYNEKDRLTHKIYNLLPEIKDYDPTTHREELIINKYLIAAKNLSDSKKIDEIFKALERQNCFAYRCILLSNDSRLLNYNQQYSALEIYILNESKEIPFYLGNITCNKYSVPYIGLESAIGFLIRPNITFYFCNINKTINAYIQTLNFYEKKIELIKQEDFSCYLKPNEDESKIIEFYDNALELIEEAKNYINNMQDDIKNILNDRNRNEEIKSFYNNAKNLFIILKKIDEINTELMDRSCPYIY